MEEDNKGEEKDKERTQYLGNVKTGNHSLATFIILLGESVSPYQNNERLVEIGSETLEHVGNLFVNFAWASPVSQFDLTLKN